MMNVFTCAIHKANADFLEKNLDCEPRRNYQRAAQLFHEMGADQKQQAAIIAQKHEADAHAYNESAIWLKMQTKMRALQQKINAAK